MTAIPLFARLAMFSLPLLLVACANTAPQAGNGHDAGYYNMGNCFDNGQAGYARDYSYGDRYLSGQSRAC
jgi:hypothetical protein